MDGDASDPHHLAGRLMSCHGNEAIMIVTVFLLESNSIPVLFLNGAAMFGFRVTIHGMSHFFLSLQ